MSFFDTQGVLSVFVDLSLVVIIINLRKLLSITYGRGVDVLHYILLLNGNAILKINDVMLVLKIIKFII